MGRVAELSKDPIVRLLSHLLRDAQAKRLRSVCVIWELQDGSLDHDMRGDPPLRLDELILQIAHLSHQVIADEDAREREAEKALESEVETD